MRMQITGRHVDLGQALQTRISEDVSAALDKYSARATEAVVTVGRDGSASFVVDCTIHLDSGIVLQTQGEGPDAHIAFENALAKIEKRVRRYRKRLKDHHKQPSLPVEPSAYFVLRGGEDEQEDVGAEAEAEAGENGHAPLIIAETKLDLHTMPVAMAVLQLEVSEQPALLFRNAASGQLNLVYRRKDGNIGWVDPRRIEAGAA